MSVIILSFSFSEASNWFSKKKDVDVNVYFYTPDNKEISIGRAKASSCGDVAYNYAYSKGMKNSNWDYICCTIEKGSSCHRKIR